MFLFLLFTGSASVLLPSSGWSASVLRPAAVSDSTEISTGAGSFLRTPVAVSAAFPAATVRSGASGPATVHSGPATVHSGPATVHFGAFNGATVGSSSTTEPDEGTAAVRPFDSGPATEPTKSLCSTCNQLEQHFDGAAERERRSGQV